jgi:hypothetical protein
LFDLPLSGDAAGANSAGAAAAAIGGATDEDVTNAVASASVAGGDETTRSGWRDWWASDSDCVSAAESAGTTLRVERSSFNANWARGELEIKNKNEKIVMLLL